MGVADLGTICNRIVNLSEFNLCFSSGGYDFLFDGTFNSITGIHMVIYSSNGVLDTSFGDSGYFIFSDNFMTFTALNLFE